MDENRVSTDLRSLGVHLQRQVSPERARQVALAALEGGRRKSRHHRWVPALAGASVFLGANIALADTADPAVRGDFLYPVDRAYEWIGDWFGPGDHLAERVAEATQLADSGQTALALETVGEILGSQVGAMNISVGASDSGPQVQAQVKELVIAASLVHMAAQSGDQNALKEAISVVQEEAKEVAEAASDGNAGGSNEGENENPSVTAPGQVDPPSVTAPGQTKDTSSATSDPGGGQGQGQGQGGGGGQP